MTGGGVPSGFCTLPHPETRPFSPLIALAPYSISLLRIVFLRGSYAFHDSFLPSLSCVTHRDEQRWAIPQATVAYFLGFGSHK